MPRAQVCERCGRTFGCGVDDAACWCSALGADQEALAALAGDFSGCLCPACLGSRIAPQEPRTMASGG